MNTIKFVYFDVGGVAMFDFTGTNKWRDLDKELGITPENSKDFEKFWNKYQPELCTGRNIETLIPLIEKQFGVHISSDYSLLINGFVKRFERNKSIWPVINEIHQHCRIGLLTNMYPQMLTEIKKHDLLPKISWDVIVDSSIEKVQKPDPRIFALAEQKAEVKEHEILFIDNTSKNTDAAKSFSWQTFLYDSSNPKKSNQKLLQLYNSLFN